MSEQLTMLGIASREGYDFATNNICIMQDLMQHEGMTYHAVIKNSYQQGFLDGFKYRLTGDDKA